LAWGVTVAALALWATSAPVSWGQVAASAGRFLDDAPADQAVENEVPCLPLPAAIQTVIPAPVLTPEPAQPPESGTFSLCGDQQATARAIEQLIAGHGFSASLSSQGNGCANLTIRVSPQMSGGTASSQLNVGLGAGQNVSVQIVSERGATHVTIGQS